MDNRGTPKTITLIADDMLNQVFDPPPQEPQRAGRWPWSRQADGQQADDPLAAYRPPGYNSGGHPGRNRR